MSANADLITLEIYVQQGWDASLGQILCKSVKEIWCYRANEILPRQNNDHGKIMTSFFSSYMGQNVTNVHFWLFGGQLGGASIIQMDPSWFPVILTIINTHINYGPILLPSDTPLSIHISSMDPSSQWYTIINTHINYGCNPIKIF